MENYQRKTILGWPYKGDTNGNIWSLKSGNKLKLFSDKDGYLQCNLSKKGIGKKGKRFKVHRLLATLFIPNPNNYPLVCHRNDISNDNMIENMYWGTAKLNAKDRKLNGNQCEGEKNHLSKLSNKTVGLIKEARRLEMPVKKMAKILEISPSTIHRIISGKSWKHLT